MDPIRRDQLIKRRTFAMAFISRLEYFLEIRDLKFKEIKVRLDNLPRILNKYESAQDELECLDEADFSLTEKSLKTNSVNLKLSSM